MATSVLAPTQITVPAGTTFWPSASGFALPAGFTYFKGTIDTSAMATDHAFLLVVQFQVGGQWPATPGEGNGETVTGGTHPQRGGGSAPTQGFESGIPQTPYPTRARFATSAGAGGDVVTVQGDLE